MITHNNKGIYASPEVEMMGYFSISVLCDSAEIVGSAGTEDIGVITDIEW